MVVIDRSQAGRELAERLARLRISLPRVIAISAGAVGIGWEIARRLGAPMDVLFPRVVSLPDDGNQVSIGVVAGGRFYPDRTAICQQHVPMQYAEALAALEAQVEMVQEREYRGGAATLELSDQAAIAVDDGTRCALAAYAVVEALHRLGVAEVVFATPSCTPGVSARIDHDVRLITLCPPDDFRSLAIGDGNIAEGTVEEATRLIAQSREWVPRESTRRELVEA